MNLIKFGSISHITKGKKPLKKISNPQDGYMPYVDIEAFETGNVKSFTDGEECLPCKNGDILIVCDGSRSGLVGKALDGYVGSTLAIITADGMSSEYLYYFLQGKYSLLNTKKKGTGTPHLDVNILNQQELALPPIENQERIVTRIEELLSQLDSGVETLKEAKQQLAVYRQAVLKEAFNGSLTNAKVVSEQPLDCYIEKPRYGTSKKCSYNVSSKSIPVYRIPNINHAIGRIDHSDIKYATLSPQEIEGITLQENDILIIRSNGSVTLVGRAALVNAQDTAGTFAGYLMRLRIKNHQQLVPKYLFWYLQSYSARIYIESKAKSTSGVHNINSSEISNLCVPICSYDEQLAIIEAIESRLSVCDSIERTIDTALQQAEALRQSILKKAFEGGFV